MQQKTNSGGGILIKALKAQKVAGVYGKQEPLSFTNDLNKRDL